MKISRRALLASAPAFAAPSLACAAVQPHSIEDFLRAPVVGDAAISSNGEQLAILMQEETGGQVSSYVVLQNTVDPAARPVKVALGPYEVNQVEWGKDDRLLIWVTIRKDPKGQLIGLTVGPVLIPIPMRRVISVSTAGTGSVVLFGDNRAVMRRSFDAASIVDYLPDHPRNVLMQAWDAPRGAYSLYEVDVYTGHATVVEKGVGSTDFWMTQRGVPMLRWDSNRRGTMVSILARAPGEKDWKLVRRVRRDEFRKLPEFDIAGPTPEPGVFLVRRRAENEDKQSLYTFDVKTLQIGPRVGDPPAQDIEGVLIDDQMQLVGTAGRAHRLEYSFTDPALASHVRGINKALQNSANVQLFDMSADRNILLIRTTGPQEPGAFHLYNRKTRSLNIVAVGNPWLQPERLARMEVLNVRTRDGAEISAYLSSPPGVPSGTRAPLVVMPHGGPELRDTYDYDVFVQVLAAQGWYVLQPNFRGSGGFGQAFAEAGRQRWASRMQEDVEDAVAHVLASGRVDEKRIAICGGSYGGYAALMGPILRPDLYRCAVSIAGVADLVEMMKEEREDGEDSPTYRYWLKLVGDPKTQLPALQAGSPRLRAAELRLPVLLMHGVEDTVVPVTHSRLMAEALKAAGKRYELVEIPNEGHRNFSPATQKLVFERTTKFIRENL